MAELNAETRLALSRDTRHRHVGNEGVVLRQDAGEVMIVNEIGIELLERVNGDSTIDEIIHGIELEYNVNPTVLRRDVMEYLHDLLELQVVVEV